MRILRIQYAGYVGTEKNARGNEGAKAHDFSRLQTREVGQSSIMKTHDVQRHPGPFRMIRVDSESAGIIIAVAFVVLGVVGLPIGKLFLLGAVALGGAVALVLHLVRK